MTNHITHPSGAEPRAETITERIQNLRRREIERTIDRLDMLRNILSSALASGNQVEMASAARIVGEDCCEIQAGMWRASR